MGTMQEEIQKYVAQTKQYDAGRPNTPTATKPGLTVATPQASPTFQPAESSGMAMPSPQRPPVATSQGQPPQWTPSEVVAGVQKEWGKDRARRREQGAQLLKGAGELATTAGRAVMNFGNSVVEGGMLAHPNDGKSFGVDRPAVQMSQPQPTPGQQLMTDVKKEVADVEAQSAINKQQADADMRGLPSPDAVKAAILERNGFNRDVPPTAKPGTTLSVTPATGATPRTPMAYNGMYAGGGNPQAKAEAALLNKKAEVMAAERKDKTLLHGPGTRDYISPMLTEEQQRARQQEIEEQRRRDVEGVAADQIQQATVRAMNDQARGLTSTADRNAAMGSYEERRGAANNRRALMEMNSNMQLKREDDAEKAAALAAEKEKVGIEDATKRAEIDARVGLEDRKLSSEEKRAYMTDATTRRGQDIEQATSKTNAEIAAESKRMDREATIRAAQIRTPPTKDPVMLEKVKGYNTAVANLYSVPNAVVTPEVLDNLRATFGISNIETQQPSAGQARPAYE